MKIKYPCLGCEDRHIGCHGQCERYLDVLRGNKIPDQDKRNNIEYNAFLFESIKRTSKRRRRK